MPVTSPESATGSVATPLPSGAAAIRVPPPLVPRGTRRHAIRPSGSQPGVKSRSRPSAFGPSWSLTMVLAPVCRSMAAIRGPCDESS